MDEEREEILTEALVLVKAEVDSKLMGMTKAQLRAIAMRIPKSFFKKSAAKLNREKLFKLIKAYAAYNFLRKYEGMSKEEILEDIKYESEDIAKESKVK